MKGKIYILKDPISKEIRYIGLTRVSLEHRLHLHLKENVKGLTHKINWIKSLKQQNLKPIIEEIDSSSDLEELCKKEIYWIQYYNSFKIISKAEYMKTVKNINENVISELSSSGLTVSPESIERVKANVKRRNNPIELE